MRKRQRIKPVSEAMKMIQRYYQTEFLQFAIKKIADSVANNKPLNLYLLHDCIRLLVILYKKTVVREWIRRFEKRKGRPFKTLPVSDFQDAERIKDFSDATQDLWGIEEKIGRGKMPGIIETEKFEQLVYRHLGGTIVRAMLIMPECRPPGGLPGQQVIDEMHKAGLCRTSDIGSRFYMSCMKYCEDEGSTFNDEWMLKTLDDFRNCLKMRRGIQFALRPYSPPGETPEPVFCPNCGDRHNHGGSDGHRLAHCRNLYMKNFAGDYHVVTVPWLIVPETRREKR